MNTVIIGSSEPSERKEETTHKCITCGRNVYCIDNMKIQDAEYQYINCAKKEGILTKKNFVITDETVKKLNEIRGSNFTKAELTKMILNCQKPDKEYFIGG